MQPDALGFLYPVVDESKCADCGLCDKVCAFNEHYDTSLNFQLPVVFAVRHKDPKEIETSRSGAAFIAISDYVLDNGGVVYGAGFGDNFKVVHKRAHSKCQRDGFKGSKYVQSDLRGIFRQVKNDLQDKKTVLFSGTPCQCAGLKSFLGKKYDNLITVDMICHGIPSPKVWQAYIDYRSKIENEGKRPFKINMRSKSSGWSYYGYSTMFDYGNGKVSCIRNSQDLFMKAFIGNICLRSSCSDCMMKGIERCTDFTLGDYWGIWNQYPKFDDNRGTSAVFVHSQRGREILNQLKPKIDCLKVDIKDAYRENRSLIDSSGMHTGRKEFLMQVKSDNFADLINQYFSERREKQMGVLWRIQKKIMRFFNGR